jgi:SulP family sulfate permease
MAVDESTETEGSHHSLVGKEVPKGVMVYRMMGAFFFGAVDKLESVLKRNKEEPEVMILRMRKVVAMDATGLNALEDLYGKLRRKGKYLVLSAPHTNPMMVMEKAGFIDRLGRENVCPHIDAALARAREILGLPCPEPKDPLREEKLKLATMRAELANALIRVNDVLKTTDRNGTNGAVKTEGISVQIE